MKRLLHTAAALSCVLCGTPAAAFDLRSPREGETVSLLSVAQQRFLALPAEARREAFTNAAFRTALAAGKWHPCPVELAWTRSVDASALPPVYAVEILRERDGFPVACLRTAATNAAIDNLEIATAYRWRVVPEHGGVCGAAREGRFATAGTPPRLLRLEGVYNTRDLGGWIGLGGRRVRQGLVFRTGGLNDNARAEYCTEAERAAADTNGVRRAREASLRASLSLWASRTNEWRGAKMLSVDVGRSWTLFRVPENVFARGGEEAAAALDRIPGTFLGISAETVEMDEKGTHVFPFDTRERLVLCRAFDAPADGFAILGASADWFWSLYLNGVAVADFRSGNNGDPGDAGSNRLPVEVREGRNLLVAVVKHGMAGCTWSCRGLEPGSPAAFAADRLARDRRLLAGLQRVVKGHARGADFVTDEGRRQMLDGFGVRTEIDLRTDEETFGLDGSPLGPRCRRVHVSSNAYEGMKTRRGREAFASAFRLFLDPSNYAVDFHCIAGQDRTGTLSFILLGILGVSEDDLLRDWEATAFWNKSTHFRHENAIDRLLAVFAAFEGETLNDRICAYVRSCGFTDADIGFFRKLMLEDEK
ncbi:MAG TPA: hypothetical protein DER26_06600 [Verrucomicrobia bacterium]|nr:hypothetical protein [Verrucomicrobiota bacterium]